MPLELVISDLDGTILETEDYHRRAYNALFEELGLPRRWSKQDYSDRLAQVGGAKFREIFNWLGRPEAEFAETAQRLYARKTALFPLRPGVPRLFAELRDEEIPLAIASTCVKSAARAVLRAALGDVFLDSLAALCAGDDVARKKPDPAIYTLAARQCGVSPGNCLVLEDTGHGLRAALAAGMTCVVTPSEFALEDEFTGAHLLAESLDEPERIEVATLRKLMTGSSLRF
jgi:HAD superfamily hydrolase (TIGR01509 family)